MNTEQIQILVTAIVGILVAVIGAYTQISLAKLNANQKVQAVISADTNAKVADQAVKIQEVHAIVNAQSTAKDEVVDKLTVENAQLTGAATQRATTDALNAATEAGRVAGASEHPAA